MFIVCDCCDLSANEFLGQVASSSHCDNIHDLHPYRYDFDTGTTDTGFGEGSEMITETGADWFKGVELADRLCQYAQHHVARGELLRFHRTTDCTTSFCLTFPYHDPIPPYHTQIHRTASFTSLISLSPHLRSTLALSSGTLLIPLSEQWLLSCTIQSAHKAVVL